VGIAEVLSGADRWCVVEDDCLDVLPTIATGCVGHVITDPPYGEEFHGKARTAGSDGFVRVEEYGFRGLSTGERLMLGMYIERVTARWALVFSDPESSRDWREALEQPGMRYCRKGVWIKLACAPQFNGDRPASGHEEITIAYASTDRTPGRTKWNGGGGRGVWTHPVVSAGKDGREHPTVKPYELMAELIGLFTDPDDVILDPFCGSGTTGVAAVRLGRRFIGIEKEPKWAELSRERIAAECSGSTLQAARAGQEPLFR
jgi:site-specific DNA-methyltransferase (adenine-specific)